MISVKDELHRGATLIHGHLCRALSEIPSYPRQVTYAFTLQNTLLPEISFLLEKHFPSAFDCTLSGPFDDLFSAGFSSSPALCRSIITVISASTV